ncbi:hypothetical protein CC86DRAFT_168342 [Ophiobolus disseminans]|uniref:Transmembrane protein n=1 Tax=Ophiobolus disseminans TaxID=1469910 RepID=A0A6A7AC28_9PLEO|nr:hypothetical protein CC86DRAFT_168342 [Ophiobolus disseminans]
MAYRHIGDPNVRPLQPAHLENIELETRYDPGAYNHVPPPGHPPSGYSPSRGVDNDSKNDDDRKPFFHSASKSSQPHGSSWPVQSQRVAGVTPLRAGLMVFDAILASTPIMFVALALTAARLDGEEVSDYGSRLAETLLLSPTIFPLIFAALMGRFFRHLGVYLAERGTTLGRLEQLVGCQSVFTALERQITLRYWSVVGLCSVLVWLLSPVGGQSALRLLGQENNNVSSITTVRYLDPQSSTRSSLEGPSSSNSARASYTSIFLAALLSSSKYQDTPMDLWGNVKLPLYRDIENSTTDEWKTVSGLHGDHATYSSLIGVPVVGLPSRGLSDFNIKARQFDVFCSSNKMMSASPKARNSSLWANVTATWGLEPDQSKTEPGSRPNYPLPFLSMSMVADTANYTNFSVASCDLTYSYLEAKVNCNGTSCGVKSMRKLDLFRDGYVKDADDFTRRNIFLNLMVTLPRVDNPTVGSPSARGSANAEKWMANPIDFIGARYSNVELYKLDPDLFARRLTILWNSFHQSTFATTALGGTLPKNLTETGVILASVGANITFNATQASVVQQTSAVYKTNWKWFIALMFCSLVLLAAAYAGLVLKYITLAPDIIGYASSLTMLNPYVPTPTGGTTLHGLERAALLHDLPVRIGDVCPNEPVGAIAFAKADDSRVARLNRRRWYI